MVSMENPITNCLPFFFRIDQPMLPHISVFLLSRMVKVYYWFISYGGNYDTKQFLQSAKTLPNVGAKMTGGF